jgi:hypothetical protein
LSPARGRRSIGLLTAEQFRAAAARTSIGDKWRRAAEFVLVYGCSQAEAARRSGIKNRQGAYQAVQVIRRALTEGERCAICGSEIDSTHGHGPQGGNP